MEPGATIRQKVHELSQAMKAEGLWKRDEPEWVKNYRSGEAMTDDFFEWLQFVYLPNLLQEAENKLGRLQRHSIAPQAIKFFEKDVEKGNLLQLLIELDSSTD